MAMMSTIMPVPSPVPSFKGIMEISSRSNNTSSRGRNQLYRPYRHVNTILAILVALVLPHLCCPFNVSLPTKKNCHVIEESPPTAFSSLHRRELMKFVISILTTQIPYPAKAQQQTSSIEFVPASPYFTGTYRDAVEIIYTQRIAVDNIASVIEDGKIEEAGFKAMQLSSQTRVAGKIVLDTYQEKISSTNNNNTLLLRFLSCQKKFAILLDLCDDCVISLQNAMKGKFGTTAVAQMRTSKVVDETKRAYDDFLLDIQSFESSLTTS